MGEPEKVGLVINKFGTIGKKRKGREIEKIKKEWVDIAGEAASATSKPTKVSRGTLFIVTRDTSWSTETSMYSSELLRRLKDITGISGIYKIRIRADKKSFIEDNPQKEERKEPADEKSSCGGAKDNFNGEDEMRIALDRYVRSMKEEKDS
ncbi:MAG: DUF721 domain-containing protein [Actinobacteria bacterium]|nr:DUF721 domain-containing protein [Actinomycetota bacterium]